MALWILHFGLRRIPAHLLFTLKMFPGNGDYIDVRGHAPAMSPLPRMYAKARSGDGHFEGYPNPYVSLVPKVYKLRAMVCEATILSKPEYPITFMHRGVLTNMRQRDNVAQMMTTLLKW